MADLKQLPAGYKTVLLHEVPEGQRRAYLDQVYGLLKENYGSYAESEDMDKWFRETYAPENQEPTNRIISMVTGPDGTVAAASAAELYKPEQAVLLSYTIGKPGSQGDLYVPMLAASKAGVVSAVKTLQDDGVPINIIAQEHQAQKAGHALKIGAGFEAGQVPLNLIEEFAKDTAADRYIIPVYKADVTEGMSYQDIVDGAARAHLFIADITPSDPDKSLSEILGNYMDGYLRTNSYFADKDVKQDPAYKSMKAFTEWLDEKHPGLTYAQAVERGVAAIHDPNSEFAKVYNNTLQNMQDIALSRPESIVASLFNNRADDVVQNKANDFLRCYDKNSLPPEYREFYDLALQDTSPVAKQMAQKELGFYFLYVNGDQSPANVKGGLDLYFAAADDAGTFGNPQARRDIARFLNEGSINGKDFETLGVGDYIKQDKYRALQIVETTLAEAALGSHFNSSARNDAVMHSIADLRDEIKADPAMKGKGYEAVIQQDALRMSQAGM